MVAIALDLASFSADIARRTLSLVDAPRLARDCGTNALSCPASALLALDDSGAFSLGQELRRTGVVVVSVGCDVLDLEVASLSCAPAMLHLCRTMVAQHRDASLLVIAPGEVRSMSAYNSLVQQIERASRIASEWCLRLLVSNAGGLGWMSLITLCQDINSLRVAPTLDLLPAPSPERTRAVESLLPLARIVRVVARNDAEDARVLGAWRTWLDGAAWGGVVSVGLHQDVGGDRYSAAGQAIALLKNIGPVGTERRTPPASATQA